MTFAFLHMNIQAQVQTRATYSDATVFTCTLSVYDVEEGCYGDQELSKKYRALHSSLFSISQ